MTEEVLQDFAASQVDFVKSMFAKQGGFQPMFVLFTEKEGTIIHNVVPIPEEVMQQKVIRRFMQAVLKGIGIQPVALLVMTEIYMTTYHVPKDSPITLEEIYARVQKGKGIAPEYEHMKKRTEGIMIKYEMPGIDKMKTYEVIKHGKEVELKPMDDDEDYWGDVTGGNYHNLINWQ